MINIALYQPEIPANTGNIIRLCANSGFKLHLIKPYGFKFDDKKLLRSGLDYREFVDVIHHDDYESFLKSFDKKPNIFAYTTKGYKPHHHCGYKEGDVLIFGPETRGLSSEILESIDPQNLIYIPMLENSRSMNLSNSVAVGAYEAWRQIGFKNAKFKS